MNFIYNRNYIEITDLKETKDLDELEIQAKKQEQKEEHQVSLLNYNILNFFE